MNRRASTLTRRRAAATGLAAALVTMTLGAAVTVAGSGPAVVKSYDGQGRLVESSTSAARTVPVTVPAAGFTIVRR
jgi:hypothetical protein